MSKRFHTDTRVSENFSIKGLQSLTGQESSNFLQYVMKEIIDNSLEATETPVVEVQVEIADNYDYDVFDKTADSNFIKSLIIRDNGPGIPEETIDKIFKDIDHFGGTKRHYKLPTRGAQGNALMTVLGIQNLFDLPLIITSDSNCYRISVRENDLLGSPEIQIEKQQADTPIAGLEIKLTLPSCWDERDFGRLANLRETFHYFVELNPHASFKFIVKEGENHTFIGDSEFVGSRLKLSENNTTGKVTWFTEEEFFNRVKADVRIEPDLTLQQFIQEFYGLSSYKKMKEVIEDFKLLAQKAPCERMQDFFTGSQLDEKLAGELYSAMRLNTKPFDDRNLGKTLGSIGKDGLKYSLFESLKLSSEYNKVEQMVQYVSQVEGSKIKTIDDLTVYYSKGAIFEGEKDVPHFFELIAMPTSWETETFGWYSRERQISLTFGINQSFIYSIPSVNLSVKRRRGKEKRYSNIPSAFYDFDYNFKVICNLTCPTIDFKDKGKQLFDTDPFVDTINEVLGKTIRKFETDIIPVLHDEVGISRQAIGERVRKMAKRANLKKKITPHGLRATAAYRFAEAGLSGQALRQIMGWAQLSTAQYYIDAAGHAAEIEIEQAFRDGRL